MCACFRFEYCKDRNARKTCDYVVGDSLADVGFLLLRARNATAINQTESLRSQTDLSRVYTNTVVCLVRTTGTYLHRNNNKRKRNKPLVIIWYYFLCNVTFVSLKIML